ncbi:hypothetical protein BH09ACT13_BH09ACT13_00570 [soil metagenome]
MSDRDPDFEELVGSDLEPAERERLQRIHDLLVAAGPPPELSAGARQRAGARARAVRRRGRATILALAAALGVIVFAVGFLAGDRAGGPGTDFTVAMRGTGAGAGSNAVLEIFDVDQAGNWPMELRVTGLEPAPSGRTYELWLTRGRSLEALCGSFLAEPDGTTVVPMNAPYRLKEFDGWVIVEAGSKTPILTT